MAALPSYATRREKIWYYGFRVICALIFAFLIFPIFVIIPLSFNAKEFLTFTPEMLSFSSDGYSTQWYNEFFNDGNWSQAVENSLYISLFATIIATSLGTLASIGLTQTDIPYKSGIIAVLISPMIVPLVISATGMFFFYSDMGLQGTYVGVILAHAALGTPFVIITVTATLAGFDKSLTRASASLGSGPIRTFFKVQMPLILPGVISGALFAFITSFDEVVVVKFVGSIQQATIPWRMFEGLREEISPVILAVATILVIVSIALLTTVELLRRRSERLRGMSAQ